MPFLKELNCKRSDSKLTQMSGLSSGKREGLFFIPFANAHKGQRWISQLRDRTASRRSHCNNRRYVPMIDRQEAASLAAVSFSAQENLPCLCVP